MNKWSEHKNEPKKHRRAQLNRRRIDHPLLFIFSLIARYRYWDPLCRNNNNNGDPGNRVPLLGLLCGSHLRLEGDYNTGNQ